MIVCFLNTRRQWWWPAFVLYGSSSSVGKTIFSLGCIWNISATDHAYHSSDSAYTQLSVTGFAFTQPLAMHCNKVCFSPVLQAQAVALTVAQAFTVAFELWQVAKEGRHHTVRPPCSHPHTQALSMEELFLSVTCVCTESALMLQGCSYLLEGCSQQVLTCLCYVSVHLVSI